MSPCGWSSPAPAHQVLIHRGKKPVTRISTGAPLRCLKFLPYGREPHCLVRRCRARPHAHTSPHPCPQVTINTTGVLTIRMLRRTASLKPLSDADAAIAGQDVPLPVPKKTRLYVEQTQRERQNAVDMHRVFQVRPAHTRLRRR